MNGRVGYFDEMKQEESVQYLSPNQKAFKRLMKNKSAVAGLVVIIIAVIIAMFGNIIAPDHTPNANDQILEISTEQPGFSIDLLKRKKSGAAIPGHFEKIVNLFTGGSPNPYEMIPIQNYKVEGDQVMFQRYTGDNTPSEWESVAAEEIVGPEIALNNISDTIEENFITTRRYLLGTDKYGRDNLSRLILGVRISLSVGLLAVGISLLIGITLGALAGFYQKFPPEINILTFAAAIIGFGFLIYTLYLFLPQVSNGLLIVAICVIATIGLFYLLYILNERVFNKLLSKQISIPVDDIIMYIINTFWPIPVLLLIFALILALGREFWQIYLAVGLVMWVEVARVVRGQFLSVREQEYVEAAEGLGFDDVRIIFKHILPNTIAPLIVITAANFASAIIIEAGLSFLGIGVQPPMPSWGTMLNEYYGYIGTDKAFLAFLPGLAIMILVLAFNLVGNGLRDALDVKTRL